MCEGCWWPDPGPGRLLVRVLVLLAGPALAPLDQLLRQPRRLHHQPGQ